jgi:hypothetical protein
MIDDKSEVVEKLKKPCGGDVILFHDEKGNWVWIISCDYSLF